MYLGARRRRLSRDLQPVDPRTPSARAEFAYCERCRGAFAALGAKTAERTTHGGKSAGRTIYDVCVGGMMVRGGLVVGTVCAGGSVGDPVTAGVASQRPPPAQAAHPVGWQVGPPPLPSFSSSRIPSDNVIMALAIVCYSALDFTELDWVGASSFLSVE